MISVIARLAQIRVHTPVWDTADSTTNHEGRAWVWPSLNNQESQGTTE